MKKIVFIIFCCVVSLSAASEDRSRALKQKELSVLRGYLEAARDSLQQEVTQRWRAKQLYIEQRESDKAELASLREKQEHVHGELARLKEDFFAKERTLEDERKKVAAAGEEWQFIGSSIEELFKREADHLLEVFPTDVEPRRAALETVRRDFDGKRNMELTVASFGDYKFRAITDNGRVSLMKRTLFVDQGGAQEMTLLRFGAVFAYGIDAAASTYLIHQSGSMGAERYSVETVGAPDLQGYLTASFPRWIERQAFDAPVKIDVMQNAQTSLLVRGKRISTADRALQFIKAGGPVMVPLFLLVLWAIILVVYKLVQFRVKHTGDSRISTVILDLLDKNRLDDAREYVKKKRGVVARVVTTCLEHSKWNRNAAEKAVKEIIIDEVPQLNKHLNTLAVIAGAAPLLGLLGTVTGMINLFKVITNYGTGDPKILAGGISEALVTTEVGLIIAIPVLLLHNYIRNRTNDIQAETEKHTIRILNHLWPET